MPTLLLILNMGCFCSKEEITDDKQSSISLESQMTLGSTNWFAKSKEESLRFYILADCIRARKRSLGSNMKHDFRGANFKVDVKLLTNGNLEVSLHRIGHEVDMHLKVVLILIDENIEVLDTVLREDAREKGSEVAGVTFPIVTLSDRIHQLSFFVVAVSISMGDIVVETNNEFTQKDYNTFFAWRSDESDW